MFRKSITLLVVVSAVVMVIAVLDTPLTPRWKRMELMGGYQMVRMSNGDWVESYVYDEKGRLRVHNWTDWSHVNHSVEYDVETGEKIGEQIMQPVR